MGRYSGRLYRTFSSLRTSVWILAAMTVFYVVGTIFPQGEEFDKYKEAGGRFLALVKVFGLLNAFTSPLFLLLSALLCANLLVCIYDRFRAMSKRPRTLPREAFLRHPNLREFGAGAEEGAAGLMARKFRIVDESDGLFVLEKGLPYWWLSWIYHLGIVVAIAGFMTTALLAFEKEVTLYKDKPETIMLHSPGTRWSKFKKALGIRVPDGREDREYKLVMSEFSSEYYQTLSFDYPKEKLARLAVGLGWRPLAEAVAKGGASPKMWKTSFTVESPAGHKEDATVTVNRPFRTSGVTLYQMGFEQDMKVKVNDEEMTVKPYEPFGVSGVEGKFTASILKNGRLYRKDGSVDEMTPYFDLSFKPKDGTTKEKLGAVEVNKPVTYKDIKFDFREFTEGSVLSYRVDPGVGLITISVWLVFVGLLLRCFAYYYRIHIGSEGGRNYILVSTRGLLADREKVLSLVGAGKGAGHGQDKASSHA